MPLGSCFCGKIQTSYTGEPIDHSLCHCLDCRKISGGLFSNNYVIPKSNFKIESGTPKTISKVADSGYKITNDFCADCGTTLFRESESCPDAIILKMGIIDDPEWPNKHLPKTELFYETRANWLHPLQGAVQKPAM